ncbi:MAG: hypothetical protein CVU87_10530 [Firmicutes bacterium HGW-Firmicutes-12]|nr:MAG: hypothetical protein CVU87_10530 [Firmicutes bacterium HGW-Firmicutes-12]
MYMKTAIKYKIWENKRPLMIYYGIIYTILVASALAITSADNGSISVSGIEFASMIFIFISGLNYFGETFRMFLQNGLSRKTLFISFVFSIIPITAFMAILDSINSLIMGYITNYKSLYLQFYHPRYVESSGTGLQFFEGILWSLFAYAMLAMLGVFITTLYYRMDKKQKLVVSIGFPLLLFVVLPMLDNSFTNGAIFRGIGDSFAFAWGYQHGFNPYYSMLTCTLFFIFFGGLAYLLIRKAVVQE